MRDTSDIAPFLLLALLLSATGLAGMVIHARNTGRLGGWLQTSVALCAAGVVLLVLGMVLSRISDVFWALVVLGGLALVIGLVLVGIAALQTKALPRWAAVALIVGSSAMLVFNDQNIQVLIAVAFGIEWVAVGYAAVRKRLRGVAKGMATAATRGVRGR